MTTILDTAALAVTAAGILAAAVALLVTRRPRAALPVLLDLLTAAGLLRLAGTPHWGQLASAAAVVALRHLILLGLQPAHPGDDDRLRATGPG